MSSQRSAHGVELSGAAIGKDLLERLGRQVGAAEKLEALSLGPHPASPASPRRQAAERDRARLRTAATLPGPASSATRTRADPTTTPSASFAARRAVSGVEIPKPTAIGRPPAALRARRTVSGSSRARAERGPVGPGRETT